MGRWRAARTQILARACGCVPLDDDRAKKGEVVASRPRDGQRNSAVRARCFDVSMKREREGESGAGWDGWVG